MNDDNKLLGSLLKLAEKEQKNGNISITTEKLNKLSDYIISHQANKANKDTFNTNKYSSYYPTPAGSLENSTLVETTPTPKFSPLFNKFQVPKPKQERQPIIHKVSKIKKFETLLINFLETIANILDNLHLFSKFPMFPKQLLGLLKQTNKLWILILVFLIRKTVSQLLNLIKKEKKVKVELNILNQNSDKLNNKIFDNGLFKKYEKILKDLKFDKTMLVLELVGNFLDLAFNFIEFYGLNVPDWFMNTLNFSSMFMTIYRMNKDDEYVDDDITEELI